MSFCLCLHVWAAGCSCKVFWMLFLMMNCFILFHFLNEGCETYNTVIMKAMGSISGGSYVCVCVCTHNLYMEINC